MRIISIVPLTMLILLFAGSASLAGIQVFDISWWSVDSGGGSSQGEDYTLSGTIGQSDAGTMGAGSYTLLGGFTLGKAILPHEVFLPLVMR